MYKLSIVLVVLLAGCSNFDAKELIDTLEFGDDEVGCFRVNGSVDVGGNPFASTDINVNLVKKKGGDEAPDC